MPLDWGLDYRHVEDCVALAPGMGGIPFFVWLCGLVKDSFWTLLWNIFSFMLELVEFYNGLQSAAKERLRGGLLLQRWLGLRLVTDFFCGLVFTLFWYGSNISLTCILRRVGF